MLTVKKNTKYWKELKITEPRKYGYCKPKFTTFELIFSKYLSYGEGAFGALKIIHWSGYIRKIKKKIELQEFEIF